MPVRPLTKELQAKAIRELNENPTHIQEDINYIREWLAKQKHIRARTDDQLLLTFLRACKFSFVRTKEKLDAYYTMRTILPELFKNRNPFSPESQEVLKSGAILPLKTPIGPDSPNVMLFRYGTMDPSKISLLDVFRINTMIIDILLMENDHLIVAGAISVLDMTNVTMDQFLSSPIITIKKTFQCYEESYLIRTKAYHICNLSPYFKTTFAICKGLLKEKFQRRFIFHSGSGIEGVFKFIPKHVLPTEYGGSAGSIQKEIDYWKQKVESYAEWFKEDERSYGTDESLRPGKPKTANELFGVDGSFRQLNID